MQMKNEMVLEAKKENLQTLLGMIEDTLLEHGAPRKAVMQLCCAAEEIFVNIASYAYAPETGSAWICLELSEDGSQAELTFSDSGRPYDPLAREDPDVTAPMEERGIGGLGIFMVKKLTDGARYEYREGKNVLSLVKNLQKPASRPE